ncbi:MAG: hypothetical protein QXH35_07080 [Nitrososphaerota archaeon]
MRVYRCVLQIRSPTVISNERGARGFYTATEALPGYTVGGAVNRALFGSVSPDRMLVSSPAYPVLNGHKTLPAHTFYYKCKICEGLVVSTLREANLLELMRHGWEVVKERLIALRDEQSHPLKSLHPRPVTPQGGRAARVAVQSIVSIGMNRHAAASQIGLLYEYTAIEPGQEYWFTLASSGGSEIPDEFDVKIGRGASRGYGRAVVRVEERFTDPPLDQSVGDEAAFYAVSPIPLRFIAGQINLAECSSRYGLKGVDGVLEPIYTGGRPAAFGRAVRKMVAGWPHGASVSRERIDCLSAGSIVAYRWRQRPDDQARALAALRYFGAPVRLDSGYVDGFCMLYPFSREPLEEVV